MTTMQTARHAAGRTYPQVSEASYRFAYALASERHDPEGYLKYDTPEGRVEELCELLAGGLSQRDLSRLIDYLKRQAKIVTSTHRGTDADVPSTGSRTLQPGVYEVAAGEIYVVKPNRQKTRLYAKRLVEINGDHINELDEYVKIEFVYAPGAIYDIRPKHLMPFERAKALTLRYGRCISCGHTLKKAQSVERGIGPVCIKHFKLN